MGLPSDNDLKFVLTPETDVAAVEKYLGKVEELLNKTGQKAAGSLTGVDAALARHQKTMEEIWAGSDPARIQQALKFQLDITEAVEHQADAEAQVRQHLLGINELTERHQKTIEQIWKDSDPSRIRDQLLLEQEILEAKEHQAQVTKEIKENLGIDQVAELVPEVIKIAEATSAYAEAQKEVGRELGHQLFTIEKIRAANDPKNIQEQVRLEREKAELLKEQEGRLKAERAKAGGAFSDETLLQGKDPKELLLAGILGGQNAGGMLGQVGGMVGEALGGPVGALIGEKLGKLAGEALEAPAKVITGSLSLVDTALKGMQGTLGPIGAGLDLASAGAELFVSGLEKVSPALAAIVGPLAQVPALLKSITESLVGMSRLASPGLGHQFDDATRDAQAVIGQRFLPLLRILIDGARSLGDTLATILPSQQQVGDALKDVRTALAAVNDVLRANGPAIREFLLEGIKLVGTTMKDLVVPAMTIFIDQMRILTAIMRSASGFTSGLSGLSQLLFRRPSGRPDASQSSFGAAAREASFEDIDQYQQQIQLAAYSSGTADIPSQQLATLNNIYDLLRDSFRGIIGGLTQVGQVPGGVAGGVGAGAVQAAAWMPNWGGLAGGVGAGVNALFGQQGGS